jgi:hypothetical protein
MSAKIDERRIVVVVAFLQVEAEYFAVRSPSQALTLKSKPRPPTHVLRNLQNWHRGIPPSPLNAPQPYWPRPWHRAWCGSIRG